MKRLFVIGLSVLAASCQSESEKQVQLTSSITVVVNDTSLRNANGTWMWKGVKYNGYIVEKTKNVITGKLPIVNGKEHGTAYGWYKNGSKRYERNYLNGNRHGSDKGWYENGKLAFVYFFRNDKYEGEQKTFYQSGRRWQCLNYVNGYEEGRQKSWNDSGRVVNNFTVKKGKLYGVIGRYDCVSVIHK